MNLMLSINGTYLDSTTLSTEEYLAITNEYNLHHGGELENNSVMLYECTADLH